MRRAPKTHRVCSHGWPNVPDVMSSDTTMV
jgi:hypothetical protein